MVSEVVSDAEMTLCNMIFCRVIGSWNSRRRLIVDEHTLLRMDLQLLESTVFLYHKEADIFRHIC